MYEQYPFFQNLINSTWWAMEFNYLSCWVRTFSTMPNSIRPDVCVVAVYTNNHLANILDGKMFYSRSVIADYVPVVSVFSGSVKAIAGVVHTIAHLVASVFDQANRTDHLKEARLGAKRDIKAFFWQDVLDFRVDREYHCLTMAAGTTVLKPVELPGCRSLEAGISRLQAREVQRGGGTYIDVALTPTPE